MNSTIELIRRIFHFLAAKVRFHTNLKGVDRDILLESQSQYCIWNNKIIILLPRWHKRTTYDGRISCMSAGNFKDSEPGVILVGLILTKAYTSPCTFSPKNTDSNNNNNRALTKLENWIQLPLTFFRSPPMFKSGVAYFTMGSLQHLCHCIVYI